MDPTPTKSRVLEAAAKVFLAHGFDAASMDMVRQEAGVSNGSLYHHFPTKAQLADALYAQTLRDFHGTIMAPLKARTSAEKGVKSLVRLYADWVVANPGRARLLLEVVRAVTGAIGAGRTGIRLSPVTPANDVIDADPQPLFEHVVRELAPLGLAYIHVIEGATGGPREVDGRPFDYAALRQAWRAAGGQGAWMVNNGYDLPLAEQSLREGADLVAFGKPFIANPDLVERLRARAPLNTPDKNTFYGGGEKGYTDYPVLSA